MSALTLERLLFDPANPSDGPSVGSYIVSAGGNVITDSGSALDINIATQDSDLTIADGGNSITVDAIQLDIDDLNHATDSVSIGDGTDLLAIAADGSIAVTQNTDPWIVSATDFDIRDLDYSQDNVEIKDAGGDALAINADGSINVNLTDDGIPDDDADAGNPFKVGSRSHFASSALSALSANGDRADLLSDAYRRIYINDAPNVGIATGAVSVTDTEVAVEVAAAPLAGRTRALFQNNGSNPVFVGKTGVTTATGVEIAKGATMALEIGEGIDLFAIAEATKTVDCRLMELA